MAKARQNQEGTFKKGATNIVIILVFGSLLLSYTVYAAIYKFLDGNKLDFIESLTQTKNIYSKSADDSDLQIIAIFIPILIIGGCLYLFRRNLFTDSYSDASNFGLHGTSGWKDPNTLRDGKTL